MSITEPRNYWSGILSNLGSSVGRAAIVVNNDEVDRGITIINAPEPIKITNPYPIIKPKPLSRRERRALKRKWRR